MLQNASTTPSIPNTLSTPLATKLLQIAGERDFIKTQELAVALNKSAQTIRKMHCEQGHVYGLVPKKIGRDLLWSVAKVQDLLLLNTKSESTFLEVNHG